MKIFFTGSVRSGRENQPQFQSIISELKKYGDVLSQHVGFPTIPKHGETHLSSENIRSREIQNIDNADIVFAEVSTASIGVGYLLAYASSLGKKIIVLHTNNHTLEVSAIIKGDPNISICSYETHGEIENIIGDIFK